MRFRFFAYALVALIGASTASATVLRPLDLEELAELSDAVLHGRVTTIRVEWNADATMPITVAEVEVIELLHGSVAARRTVRVTTPGGTIDGVSLDYAGRPRFTPGRETVLFLAERSTGRFIPVGLVQGTFDVAPALASGKRPLRRPLHGADMIGAPATALPLDLDGLRQALSRRPRNLSGGNP